MLDILKQWFFQHVEPHNKILVAYSGGRDSHVLLDSLVKLKSQYTFQLEAIHVNHGLQAVSQSWVTHCQTICSAYDIPLHIINLSLQILPGESLEEKARIHRYQAIKNYVDENTLLLTAHTQDDQAETFVLQLIRGSGIKGLAGIAPIKLFGKGSIARPLLTVSRDEIADYATNQQLKWIEDPSNDNLALRRNYIRKEILKPLNTLHTNSSHCIARSAKHCQEALTLLEEYLSQDLAHCLGNESFTLKVEALKNLTTQKQAWVLRHWLSSHQVTLPTRTKCADMLKQMLQAKGDAQPQVAWGDWLLRRYQQHIYLLPKPLPFDASRQYEWDISTPIQLTNGQRWQAVPSQGKGVALSKLANRLIRISYRQGGERCHLANQQNSKALKKVLQQLDIPPWEREKLPLFYQGDSLIGVGALFICQGWQVSNHTAEGLLFEQV